VTTQPLTRLTAQQVARQPLAAVLPLPPSILQESWRLSSIRAASSKPQHTVQE